MIGGEKRTMFTTGDLARRLDRQDQTIRKWERQGIIPKTPFRSKTNRRLYTEEQVMAIVDCVEKYKLKPGVATPSEFIVEVHENFLEATPKLN